MSCAIFGTYFTYNVFIYLKLKFNWYLEFCMTTLSLSKVVQKFYEVQQE